MSALPPNADIRGYGWNVRLVPRAEIHSIAIAVVPLERNTSSYVRPITEHPSAEFSNGSS